MSTRSILPPSVEERLAGWAQIQERRTLAPLPARPPATLTISRQFGCEGFPLALRLQARLESATGLAWSILDKALLEKVAQDEGISMRLLSDLGGATRYLEAFGFHPNGAVTQEQAFAKVARSLVQVARQGRAIIVGQGGAILCRGMEHAYHFRLEAGFEWRVEAIMRGRGLDRAAAEREVKIRTRMRDQFIRQVLDADVGDRSHYDAVFNNERHSVDQIAAAIEAYVGVAIL